jgi:hypothetical protein
MGKSGMATACLLEAKGNGRQTIYKYGTILELKRVLPNPGLLTE